MCTVSWLLGDNSYQLLFNRDEQKSRVIASPPSVSYEADLAVLAPRDEQGGGTWIAANSRGISIALLNASSIAAGCNGRMSRGLLPQRLIRLGSVKRIIAALKEMDLSPYLPFTLLAFDPLGVVQKLEWNGELKRFSNETGAYGLATSSSFESEAVREFRVGLFKQMTRACNQVSAELLYAFHENHGDEPSAFSPCMHRPDAETVSFSWIQVDASRVSLFYAPGAPCQWADGSKIEVPRNSEGAL